MEVPNPGDQIQNMATPTPTLSPIQEQVMALVLDRIAAEELPPGSRISPDTLSATLGISHIPVREALRALAAVGHVERIERKGYFVPQKSIGDLEDIYRLRRILEFEALARGIPQLTSEDVEAMRRMLREMEDVRLGGDRLEISNQNRAFHLVVVQAAQSERLERFITQLWLAAARYYVRHLDPTDVTRATAVNDQHRRLLEAYEARDVESAQTILDEHLSLTLEASRLLLS